MHIHRATVCRDLPEAPDQSAQERADAQAVFDSIRIAPAN